MTIAARLESWLLRRARDETLPIILKQRRIFIVPTRSGLLFALVLAVMLLAAINYDLALGHALVFLLAGIGLVAMVHTLRNLLGLQLTPGRAEAVFAGELARFPLFLENADGQARRALVFSFADSPAVTIDVAAGGSSCVAIPCPAPRRGYLDPGRLTLSTRYPLGLFRAWCHPQPRLSCLVYPRPIETPLPPGTVAHSAQQHGQQQAAGDEDFSGLRLRQPDRKSVV